MDSFDKLLSWIKTTWDIVLFHLGDSPFTLKTLLLLFLSFSPVLSVGVNQKAVD
ncbi:MAG: hypothetical protein ABFC28_04695 [Rikenellaceae bacterium]